MYQVFFGLTEAPFSITADTDFFYAYRSHQEAFNTLLLALSAGEGFIKISGEVGSGKTLLCRKLLASLGEEFVTAWLPNPQLNDKALRYAVAEELGLKLPRNAGQHRLLKQLNEHLIELQGQGKKMVLLIDEAQALSQESLEAVRLLSNLETQKRKLLQVVLLGQPELDRKLEQPSIRQLKQRIGFSCRLSPLDRRSLPYYLQHRLQQAGYNGPRLFSAGSLDTLYRASRGSPRLVNILSHKALMLAYGKGRRRIDRSLMRLAVRDTESVCRQGHPWGWVVMACLALASGAALAGYYMKSLPQ
jgi:MSHA biogenesis protein MshM